MIRFHIEIERWKYNKKYNLYISSRGRIKDCNKKLICPKVNPYGYLEYKKIMIHRLVMETFKPIDKYMTVDHLDHNKRNNCLDNLEWVSKEENQKRANRDFIIPDPKRCEYVIENSNKPITFQELAKKIGIDQDTIIQRLTRTLKGPHHQLKYYGKRIQIIRPEVA